MSRLILLLLGIITSWQAGAAEQLYTLQPSVTPALAHAGAWPVGVKTISATNPEQVLATNIGEIKDRTLTLEIWYPAAPAEQAQMTVYDEVTRSGKQFSLQGSAYRDALPANTELTFPLIIVSHGYSGYRAMMFYLAEHLASHGYVVVAIDHTDSRNSDIDFSKAPGAGFISTLVNRARDQQFTLDHLAENDFPLAAITDSQRAAIIGYSMGGYGALNTVGGCYEYSSETLEKFGVLKDRSTALLPFFNYCAAGRQSADPRWKALLAIAPWGGELQVHDPASLGALELPALFVVGDKDDISGYENGVRRLFQQIGSKHRYLMVYENARQNIAAHPAPRVAYSTQLDLGHYYEAAWNTETINRVNKHMALAFFNCHVKREDSACEFLPESEDVAQVRKPDGQLSPPWPGFPDKWGAGIKFYSGN